MMFLNLILSAVVSSTYASGPCTREDEREMSSTFTADSEKLACQLAEEEVYDSISSERDCVGGSMSTKVSKSLDGLLVTCEATYQYTCYYEDWSCATR